MEVLILCEKEEPIISERCREVDREEAMSIYILRYVERADAVEGGVAFDYCSQIANIQVLRSEIQINVVSCINKG